MYDHFHDWEYGFQLVEACFVSALWEGEIHSGPRFKHKVSLSIKLTNILLHKPESVTVTLLPLLYIIPSQSTQR